MTNQNDPVRMRVRVWFGSEVICSLRADPERAYRYARLMAQRYAGLRVTIDAQPERDDTPLPREALWPLTVK